MQAIRSLSIWLGVVVVTGVMYPIGLLVHLIALPFDPTRKAQHWYSCRWGRALTKLNSNWSFTLEGTERIPKDRPLILISNHTGMADILMAFCLDHQFKWIAKEIIFKVPMLGWFMSHSGYIRLRRGNRDSIVKCMERARWYLDHGISVLLFPEGTRTEDGELRPFKRGAFRLAIDSGCDILPMAMINTEDALPKNTWLVPEKRSDMKLLVGEVIPTKGLTLKDLPSLIEHSRAVIQTLKDQLAGKLEPSEVSEPDRATDFNDSVAV